MSHVEIALALAAEGIAVFPCHSSGEEAKRPMPGVFWRNQSSTDRARIEAWWRRWPGACVGIDLAKSGLLVIDCDCKPGRPNGVANFAGLGHDLSAVPTVDTPSGGRHYYFRQTFDPPHGNSRGSLPPGIDVRGHGGYVIAPGCKMESGNYVSVVSCDPPSPPPWLVGLLRPLVPRESTFVQVTEIAGPSPYGQEALNREVANVANAASGTRNETLNIAAFNLGQLSPHILSTSEITAALTSAGRACGLGPQEIARTIRSGMTAGMSQPRSPDTHIHVRELVDVNGLLADAETGEVLVEPEIPSGDLPDEIINNLPGLLGDIVQWIVASSERPQPALALGAALAVIGTAAGRHVAGPTLSGTQLYIVGLGKTGYGKDHPRAAIATLLESAGMLDHLGPDEFVSMPSVINFLLRRPLSCCPMDEFGAFLKRVNNRRASGFEASISKTLRTAWGASFKTMMTPEWAGRPATPIVAPCLSIYGVSTPDEFYAALSSGDASNGFLNRFLIFEAKTKPTPRRATADPTSVPSGIAHGLRDIYLRQGDLAPEFLNTADAAPKRDRLAWATPDADDLRMEFSEAVERECNDHPERAHFLARTAEMAVRLATIRAIAADAAYPSVSRADLEWGIALARYSAETMMRGVGENMVESDFQANYKLVLGYIRERGTMDQTTLYRRIDGRIEKRQLDSIISTLAEAEQIELCKVAPGPKGGRPKTVYRAVSLTGH